MDEQTAEVITIAIEQQMQNERDLAHQQTQPSGQNNGSAMAAPDKQLNDREIQLLAEQVHSRNRNESMFELSDEAKRAVRISHENSILKNESSELPRSSTHKNFAVDPSLNVAVGLVPDIIGPKLSDEEFFGTHEGKGKCSRCKKPFEMPIGEKPFKLCEHCRELQRMRSRRWQEKIKTRDGKCRRCGCGMENEDPKFVLCNSCRMNLRTRKFTRFESGKCVHCSGINDQTRYKVCTRCRDNDRERRRKLESEGCCNRCAQPLKDADGPHKVCVECRIRKRKFSKGAGNDAVAAAAAAAAHRAEPIQGPMEQVDPSVENSNEVYQQLEANLFASRIASQSTSTKPLKPGRKKRH